MRFPLTPTQAANAVKVLASWATGLNLRIAPLQIDFEPTNRCNLRCRFCPNRFRNRAQGTLDPDLFRRVVDETASTTLEYHLDMMGEPLLHPGLVEMVAYAGRRGARLVLYTNLAVRDDALIRTLARSSLDRVVVNLSSLDAHEYRTLHGRDALAGVRHNLDLFRQARHGPRPRLIVSWLTTGRDGPPRDLAADQVQVHAAHDWLGTPGLEPSIPRRGSARGRCSRLWASASILWDGRIATCCYDHAGRRILGDLRASPLVQLWNSPEMWTFRRHHRTLDPCRGCVDPDPQVSLDNLWFLSRNRLAGGRTD